MPGLQLAHLSVKSLRERGGNAVVGAMLIGTGRAVMIASMTSTVSELVRPVILLAGIPSCNITGFAENANSTPYPGECGPDLSKRIPNSMSF
jgi:uncharacterized membrane protein